MAAGAAASSSHHVLVLEVDSAAAVSSLRWRVVQMHHESDAKRAEALAAAVAAIDTCSPSQGQATSSIDEFVAAVPPYFLPFGWSAHVGPTDSVAAGESSSRFPSSTPLCITGAAMQVQDCQGVCYR
jgi:hypothetical protein